MNIIMKKEAVTITQFRLFLRRYMKYIFHLYIL